MGSSSSRSEAPQLGKTEAEIVALMFPVYFNADPLTDAELDIANSSWKLILSNTSAAFLAKRADPNFPHATCMMYFYNCFYERLFDVHPAARDLFKDVNSQGKFLVKMISLSLSEKADPAKYERTLVQLAEIHNERGIKAVEYGMVGEVLFWALRQSVGLEIYTVEVHIVWVKIYSRMLKTMVPVAVAYELKDGSAQTKRFFAQSIGLSTAEESVLENFAAAQKANAPTLRIDPAIHVNCAESYDPLLGLMYVAAAILQRLENH